MVGTELVPDSEGQCPLEEFGLGLEEVLGIRTQESRVPQDEMVT